MVINVAPKLAPELVQEVGPNARRIGTVDRDSHPAIWDILVTREEGEPLGVRYHVRGDSIAVDADAVDPRRQEDAAESDLGADAVAIGAHVP